MHPCSNMFTSSLYLPPCPGVQWATGDEPVWRQVLRHLLQDSDPAIAQQAATALGE
jgi:hypothetical protein